jgi:hypothetical protein
MSSKCPAAATAPRSLDLQLSTVEAGARLVRYHRNRWPANSFNPNNGKRIEIPEDGARFNPFPAASGDNVPTLYAADTKQAAALESVFHNVSHSPSPSFPKSQLDEWNVGDLELLRDLSVLELINPRLRQLTVRGRRNSIEERELVHSRPSQYPRTRTWARFLHASVGKLDGLAWRPRLGGVGLAYMFWGDRCGSAFNVLGSSRAINSGPELADIERISAEASIRLV